jgi:hypothetical protein
MIIPKIEREAVLQKAITSLSKNGQRTVYFTQTHQRHHSTLVASIKPLLKWVTTIDFGKITYEDDFVKTLSEAGLTITERKELYTSRNRAMVLIVAKPSK